MAMNQFRRTAAQETKQKSGKGGKGSYYDKLAIPKGSPTPIIILRGNYEDTHPAQELVEFDPATGRPKPVINDFFKFKKHTRKLLNGGKEEYRDEPCSAGIDPHNPQPCAGCSAMDRGDKSVGVKDVYAFSILHMHPYHSHPLLDRNTRQIVMKNDNSGPVIVYSECEGRTCNFCRVSRNEQPIIQQGEQWPGFQANQIGTTFGRRRYLEFGKSHLSNLDGFENSISSICHNPQCGNQLSCDGFACPTCNTLVIDMSTDPRSDKDINEAVIRPYPCLRCQRNVLLREVVSCEFCEAAGRQFQQLSLFDNVLFLFRQGEGTKSTVMMQRNQPIDQFGQQLTQMGWLRDGKTIRQLIEEIGKPYDFAELFKPRSLEDQAKRLSLQVPQQQSAYGAFGQPQQPMYGAPPQGYPQQPGFAPQPQQGGYPPPPQGFAPQPQQQAPQGFLPPPGAPQPQQQAYAPYPAPQPQPSNNVGPAPFQPATRPNFGS